MILEVTNEALKHSF